MHDSKLASWALAAVCIAWLAAWSAPHARADTLSAAAGMQSNPASPVCFGFGDVASGYIGVSKLSGSGCAHLHWIIPVYWDNFYSAWTNRTVTVHGRRPSASAELRCYLYVTDTNGDIVASDTELFPVTSGYTSVSLTVNQVTSGRSGVVSCFFSSLGTEHLLSIEYSK